MLMNWQQFYLAIYNPLTKMRTGSGASGTDLAVVPRNGKGEREFHCLCETLNAEYYEVRAGLTEPLLNYRKSMRETLLRINPYRIAVMNSESNRNN